MGRLAHMWAAIRQQVRRRIGFIRLMEWRNQLLLSPGVPRLRWIEEREVARARRELGRTLPSAAVACVVPTFRRPEQLLKALSSILDQTFRDLVVIVVDDGGGLPELPSDPRVFSLSLSKNVGVAGLVRNVGIRASRSRYIAFLDDDNTWDPKHLEHCVGALESGVDLVYTAILRRTSSGRKIDVLSAPFDRRALAHETCVDTSGIVVRRGPNVYFSRLPRGRRTVPGEDWEFVYRLSRHARVQHLPIVTVDYLVNPESFYTPWTEAVTR